MKYAVYVEGRSELHFVADVLQKYSDYDPSRCGFRCYNLKADDLSKMNNPIQGDESSSVYYQIINVNNDNYVISKLNKDIPGLQRQGFNVIIGLKENARNFVEGIRELKKQRVSADYELFEFSDIDSLDCRSKAEGLIMKLKTYFGNI